MALYRSRSAVSFVRRAVQTRGSRSRAVLFCRALDEMADPALEWAGSARRAD
jgi:hypothetical protein